MKVSGVCYCFLILLLYTWRKKFEGEIFLRYLAGYGLGKCVIEWLRTDKLYIPKTKIPVSLLVSAALFLILWHCCDSAKDSFKEKREGQQTQERGA